MGLGCLIYYFPVGKDPCVAKDCTCDCSVVATTTESFTYITPTTLSTTVITSTTILAIPTSTTVPIQNGPIIQDLWVQYDYDFSDDDNSFDDISDDFFNTNLYYNIPFLQHTYKPTTTTPFSYSSQSTATTDTQTSVKIGMIILGVLLFILFVSLGLLKAFKNRYNTLTKCELLSLKNTFFQYF